MSQPTDFEKHIKRQLLRISHLMGYPVESIALRDYISALSTAGDEQAVTRVMDSIIQDTADPGPKQNPRDCPTAAMIRRIAYERREGQQTRQNRCDFCNGNGTITIWKLVTYIGKSFKIRRAEIVTAAAARELSERIATNPLGDDNQQVLSAAMECTCRKVVAMA